MLSRYSSSSVGCSVTSCPLPPQLRVTPPPPVRQRLCLHYPSSSLVRSPLVCSGCLSCHFLSRFRLSSHRCFSLPHLFCLMSGWLSRCLSPRPSCVLCLLSSWLLRCLSSRRQLPTTGASTSRRDIASYFASLIPPAVRSDLTGWLSCYLTSSRLDGASYLCPSRGLDC